jgi:hypothetical protein
MTPSIGSSYNVRAAALLRVILIRRDKVWAVMQTDEGVRAKPEPNVLAASRPLVLPELLHQFA